jgi:hypothetical protein
MDRAARFGIGLLFGLVAICGCGKDSPSDATATSSAGAVVVKNAADPATNPVAGAAASFLDAVIKGDRQKAFDLLTPLAQQRVINKDEHFAPQGLEKMTFRVGEVRTPTESQAIVQCILTGLDKDGQQKDEEMCCLMRLVDNKWQVSGIAAGNGPNRPPMILDFENPRPDAQPRQPVAGPAGQDPSAPPAGRPTPPRTAQEIPPARY